MTKQQNLENICLFLRHTKNLVFMKFALEFHFKLNFVKNSEDSDFF